MFGQLGIIECKGLHNLLLDQIALVVVRIGVDGQHQSNINPIIVSRELYPNPDPVMGRHVINRFSKVCVHIEVVHPEIVLAQTIAL